MARRKRGPRAYARPRGPFRNYYGRRPGPLFGEPRISVNLAGGTEQDARFANRARTREARRSGGVRARVSAGRLPSFETAEIQRGRAARNTLISRRLFSVVHDRNLDVLNLRHAVANPAYDNRSYLKGRARVMRRRGRALERAKRSAGRAEAVYNRVLKRQVTARPGRKATRREAAMPSIAAVLRPFTRRRRERADRRQLAAGRASGWQGIDTMLGELRAPARVRRAPVTTPFLPGVVQRAARESARPKKRKARSSPVATRKRRTTVPLKKAATRAVKAAVHKPTVKAEIKKVAKAEVKKVYRAPGRRLRPLKRRHYGVQMYAQPIGPAPRSAGKRHRGATRIYVAPRRRRRKG